MPYKDPEKARANAVLRTRRYELKNPDKTKLWRHRTVAKWRKNNPERSREITRANVAVCMAVKKGVLIRPGECSQCNGSKGRIEAHHHLGYDKVNYLNVQWLCSGCHYLTKNHPPQIK